nr:hypothetical protein [Tanacetum cinerariifolium]
EQIESLQKKDEKPKVPKSSRIFKWIFLALILHPPSFIIAHSSWPRILKFWFLLMPINNGIPLHDSLSQYSVYQNDILGFKDSEKRRQIFRGMTVLLRGDFRQLLPVIPKAKRPELVQACINRSELWRYCKVFTLTYSMRVNEHFLNGEINTSKQEFNQWVLAMGDGILPAKMKEGEDEPTWIDIPKKFLIKTWDCPIRQIIEETYPDFTSRQTNNEYPKERAILTPRNEDANAINEFMFEKLSGEYVAYNSADEICKASTDNLDQHQLYPVEFLIKFLKLSRYATT